MELFNVVTHQELGLAEFGHALDLNNQTVIHWQRVPLILDDRGKQEPVSP
jgi:hypothetical protein